MPSSPPIRVADGIMECQIINDKENKYTFQSAQPVHLKANYQYALHLEGVSKVSTFEWEDFKFNGNSIKFRPCFSGSGSGNESEFPDIKFQFTSDVSGQLSGRMKYQTTKTNDTPRLTWHVDNWPDPSGQDSSAWTNDISRSADRKHKLIGEGSFSTWVGKAMSIFTLDAGSLILDNGSYALNVTNLVPEIKAFWKDLSGPPGPLQSQPINLLGVDGFTVEFTSRLHGPPLGGLKGSLQYNHGYASPNTKWQVYKLD